MIVRDMLGNRSRNRDSNKSYDPNNVGGENAVFANGQTNKDALPRYPEDDLDELWKERGNNGNNYDF